MKDGWEYKKPITDVVWFQEGPGVRNTQYTDTGIKLLNVANLVDGHIDLTTSDRYISIEEAYGKYKHFLVDEGDLILASSGIKVDYIEKKMGFIKKEHLPLCMNTSTIRFKTIDSDRLYIYFFMYFLKSFAFKKQLYKQITGSAQLNFGPSHLKRMTITLPPLSEQQHIVEELDLLSSIIEKKKAQLNELDNLAQSLFYEMFGDIENNTKSFETYKLGEVCNMKAGKAIKADELHDESCNLYPCYGGNGIRGYIDRFSHSGDFPIIGRQGALCGNVNYAMGDFYATEHAVVVTPIIDLNTLWLYYALIAMRLGQYAHGVAQPGLSVKDLNPLSIPIPQLSLQQQFATKIEAIEHQKELIKKSIKEVETLFNSRMDYYFN